VSATEQAYSLGIDSTRLNPWARRARRLLVDYPDMLQALDRLVRQMRRIAYTINEPETSWSELAQKQEWARDYAQLLEEMGSTLRSLAEHIHSSATSRRNNLPERETLRIQVEHAQQQLRSLQEQLAQDAKENEAHMVNAASSPSISIGSRIAIRGAILTDLRRMLDEVHDMVAMTSHPSQ
jgi:chromosome segregation ATPase